MTRARLAEVSWELEREQQLAVSSNWEVCQVIGLLSRRKIGMPVCVRSEDVKSHFALLVLRI